MKLLVRTAIAGGVIGGCVFAAVAARPHPATTSRGVLPDAPTGAFRGSASWSKEARAARSGPPLPRVGRAVKFDVSPPLRSMPPIVTPTPRAEADERGTSGPIDDTRHDRDPVVQGKTGS